MSSIWAAFKEGASSGLKDGLSSGLVGIVYRGAEAALADPEVKSAVVEATAAGVREATIAVVGNVRANFEGITASAAEGLNPDNVGLWAAIRDSVVGGTKGLRKLLRFSLSGMLWCGVTLASFIGVGIVRTSGLNREANVRTTSERIRRMAAGLIQPARKIDPAQLNTMAEMIVG